MSSNEWEVFKNLMISQYSMKFNQFVANEEPSLSEIDESSDSSTSKNGLYKKVMDIGSAFIQPQALKEKRKKNFRRLSAEVSNQELEKILKRQEHVQRMQLLEEQIEEAERQGKSTADIIGDAQTAQLLFERHHEKVRNNHEGNFQGETFQLFAFD
mmetsp:Transcript_5732/g.9832  ORF Transcript_5732/g.9832 Transcript_5732/m.9832 type:complete len:156 (+) Transcript_5732:124-591(+)